MFSVGSHIGYKLDQRTNFFKEKTLGLSLEMNSTVATSISGVLFFRGAKIPDLIKREAEDSKGIVKLIRRK